VAAAEMARDRAQSRQHQLDIKVKPTGQHFMAAIALTDSAMAIAASYAARVFGIKTGTLVRDARRARGNGAGGIRERLHDDDGLAAQGGIFLLFARCKKGVEIEEQPLDGIWPEVTKRSDLTHKRTNHELRPPYERHRARP